MVRLHQAAADETGRAGDQHGLARRQCAHEIFGRRDGRIGTARRKQVAQAEDHGADAGEHHQGAPVSVRDEPDRGGIERAPHQRRQHEHEDRAIIDREQGVVHALGCRQLAAHVLLEEIRERDEHLDRERRDDHHREHPAQFEEAEHDEQTRVDEAARRMQRQFMPLRGPPGEPLGQLVMIDRVESRHRDLDRDQGPEQRRHGCASRKAAVWQISRPSRG